MDKLQSTFKTEAEELLSDLERAVLVFETDLRSKESINTIFRVMHTLKGSASMFGFEALSALTHDLETVFDDIRNGAAIADQAILEITLSCVDHIKNLLSDPEVKLEAHARQHQVLLQKIGGISRQSPQARCETSSADAINTYYIYCKPSADIFLNGTNPLFLIDDLVNLGEAVVFARRNELPSFDNIQSDRCYISFEVILASKQSLSDIEQVFLFAEDKCQLRIEKLAEGDFFSNPRFKTLLMEASQSDVMFGPDRFKSSLTLTSAEETHKGTSAGTKAELSTIRVSSDKLDELLNLVSELVTSQARLSLLTETYAAPDLVAVAENMEKLTRRLRDNAFNICLVPIESLVVRFQRLVRDLSKDLGKDVNFITEGGETELDRSIIEKLTDPILHILRNCIDHGIESPEQRLASGKNAKGNIRMSAYHSGTNVFIEIVDDGKGIDPIRIRQKALERGIISSDSNLNDQELINLIFHAGFSTAETITDVSGRGVGMDIVRRNIEAIHGEVNVKSKVGEGTQLTIKLPLTLSILDGMLVNIASTRYLLPLSAIQTCYEIESSKVSDDIAQKQVINGELLPVFNLHSAFGGSGKRERISQVIKINYQDFPVGISVDGIIGEYQAVMKPLGEMYKGHDEFSGATILGDGSVALVIDTSTLVRQLIENQTVTLANN